MRDSTDFARSARRFAPAPDVRAARTGGELVLLQLGRGHYYTLNESGAWIWERMGTGATFGELCAAIVERFEIDEPAARADLIELLDELEREGLLL